MVGLTDVLSHSCGHRLLYAPDSGAVQIVCLPGIGYPAKG
jgi:hypothetical protein